MPPWREGMPATLQGAIDDRVIRTGTALRHRYAPEALRLVPATVRQRLARACSPQVVAWELLYRLEPDLYARLVAGERLHPKLVEWLPAAVDCGVEVGAGLGRLTVRVAPRCRSLLAVERAASMQERLRMRLREERMANVAVCGADMAALPLRTACADMVVTCAALTPDAHWGGDDGLAELERACRPGGMVVIIWPHTPAWLEARGYRREVFAGEMVHEFSDAEEAVELATIFYPDHADDVAALGSRWVPYEVLGINAPRDLAWKVMR